MKQDIEAFQMILGRTPGGFVKSTALEMYSFFYPEEVVKVTSIEIKVDLLPLSGHLVKGEINTLTLTRTQVILGRVILRR